MKTLLTIFAAAMLTLAACNESTVNPPNTNNNTNTKATVIQLLTSTAWEYSSSTGEKPQMKSMTFTTAGTFTLKTFANTDDSGTYSVSDDGKILTITFKGKSEATTIVEITAMKLRMTVMLDKETTLTFIPAAAQITGWERATTGIVSNFVYDFATTETVVYAGTQNGLFRSTNDGDSWHNISLTANANFRFIESVDARSSDYVAYICWDGGKNQKIMFTTNGGAMWNDAMLVFPSVVHLTSIAIGPTYWAIGSDNGVYVIDTAQVMSNSRTSRQTDIGSPIPGTRVTGVKIMPGNPNNGIIASTTGGLILTTDRGTTWLKFNTPTPLNNIDATATRIAVPSADAITIYDITGNIVAVNNAQGAMYRGVCYTPDGRLIVGGFSDISTQAKNAVTWTPAAEGLPTTGFAISALAANSKYIFLGRDSNGDCIYRRSVNDF